MDKLPRKELHGQTPVVTHCTRQNLNKFEDQARKGEPDEGRIPAWFKLIFPFKLIIENSLYFKKRHKDQMACHYTFISDTLCKLMFIIIAHDPARSLY